MTNAITQRRFWLGFATAAAIGSGVVGCDTDTTKTDIQVPLADSSKLTHTAIVPTLDSPVDRRGNTVWCASFQLAWNRAKSDVFGEPLRIAGAQVVTDRLNGSTVTEADLPAGSFYAAAGMLDGGIIAKVRRDMAAEFPTVDVPEFPGAAGFVAYAYMDVQAKFRTPFVDLEKPMTFTDAEGVRHQVAGFGFHEGTDWDLRRRQADQVEILFTRSTRTEPEWAGDFDEFALDLTAHDPKHQVIVVRMKSAGTLEQTLAELAKADAAYPATENRNRREITPDEVDELAIPNCAINVVHRFAELVGSDRTIENAKFNGLPMAEARQSIRFRLDKSGAAVISESYVHPAAGPRRFVFDRPFLVVMRKRGAVHPYFAAWIAHPEMLELMP